MFFKLVGISISLILISLKMMTIFNNTSADTKTKSVDVLVKMVLVYFPHPKKDNIPAMANLL